MNWHHNFYHYASQICAAIAVSLGILTYLKPIMSMVGLEQWSAIWGMVSVVGLALVNVYGLVRGTIRQHNLADAEAARETWKGKFDVEKDANELLRRRLEDMQLVLRERENEIEHLRRQLQKPN